jgi:ribosome-binding protein aMBF1 (putative translation factor)
VPGRIGMPHNARLSLYCRGRVVVKRRSRSHTPLQQRRASHDREPEEILDARVPTPAELAQFVKSLRDENKWSQATLAEISGLTERTIQRVRDVQSRHTPRV